MVHRSCALIVVIVLLLLRITYAEVIFEDSFDARDDWTVTQPLSGGGGSWPASGFISGWTGYYNGMSYRDGNSSYGCTGGAGNNNMYLDTGAGAGASGEGAVPCEGGSGKCLTFWQESCTVQFEDSDGQIGKDLGSDYDDLYVRMSVRFQSNFDWMDPTPSGHNDVAQMKILHLWHWTGSGSMWNFFDNNNTRPMAVPGLAFYEPGDMMMFYNLYRCEHPTGSNYCTDNTPSMSCTNGSEDYINIGSISSLRGAGELFDGDWHFIEMHFKMNTNTGATFNADGVYQVWIDGEVVINRSNIVWSKNTSDTSPRRGFRYVTVGGNNNNAWQTSGCSGTACEQWYAVDNVVISTTSIGTEYEIGGGASPAVNTVSGGSVIGAVLK